MANRLAPLCALLLAPLGGTPQALTLDAVRIEGNEVTKERVITRELHLPLGTPITQAQLDEGLQAVRDLGLFQRVDGTLLEEQGRTVLQIQVEEKLYLLPIPRLDLKPEGDMMYGAELRLDNIGGLNQRVKLVYRNKRSLVDDLPMQRELELGYYYPYAFDTPFSLDLSTRMDRTIEISEPPAASEGTQYLRDYHQTHAKLGRWLDNEGPSRGWHLTTGLLHRQRDYEHLSGDLGIHRNSRAMALIGELSYQGVHDHYYFRSGHTYGYQLELGSPPLGSEYSYHRNQLYLRRYQPLSDDGHHSLHTQLKLGVANGMLFDDYAFSLGGADSLRGYAADENKGNAYLLLNLEYLHRIGGYPQLRGLAFTDIGRAYPTPNDLRRGGYKYSVGIGLRWKMQSFVNITLSTDYAYNVETGAGRTYFSTSGSF